MASRVVSELELGEEVEGEVEEELEERAREAEKAIALAGPLLIKEFAKLARALGERVDRVEEILED